MKKLIYITAVPQSLRGFVLPRMGWIEEEYEVVGICSGASSATASLCSFFFCHIVNRFILILGKETFLSWIAKTAVLSLTYIIVSIPVLFISCKGARLLTERIKKYVKN